MPTGFFRSAKTRLLLTYVAVRFRHNMHKDRKHGGRIGKNRYRRHEKNMRQSLQILVSALSKESILRKIDLFGKYLSSANIAIPSCVEYSLKAAAIAALLD